MLKHLWRSFFSPTGFIYLSLLLVLTSQAWYSPIHGDGAVYATLARFFADHPGALIERSPGVPFFDHPYLFFYFSYPILNLLPDTELAAKIPNFLIALFTLWFLLPQLSRQAFPNLGRHWQMLPSCLVAWTGLYELQIRQPSLDPLAHALALSSILFIVKKDRALGRAGFLLGLAFLTKGLEILPYLATITVYLWWHHRGFRNSLLFLLGLCIPLGLWITGHLLGNTGWLPGYWQYQFGGRFLNPNYQSEQVTHGASFLLGYFQHLIWIPVLLIWRAVRFPTFKHWKDWGSTPLVQISLLYTFWTLLAFALIKKDSLQHYTGLVLLGSLLLAPFGPDYLPTFLKKHLHPKWLSTILMLLSVTTFIGLNFFQRPKMEELWFKIAHSQFSRFKDCRLTIIIPHQHPQKYELLWTAQWHWRFHKLQVAPEVPPDSSPSEELDKSPPLDGSLVSSNIQATRRIYLTYSLTDPLIEPDLSEICQTTKNQ